MRNNSSPRWLAVASGLAIVVVVTGAAWFCRTQEEDLRHRAKTELQGIAHLKADQIAAWRHQRLADAYVLMESPSLSEQVARLMATPHPENTKDMLTRFRSLQKHYGYSDVLLVDADGQVRLRVGGSHAPLYRYTAQSLAETLLVRRDGDSVLFLNDMRFRKHTAPKLRIPLSRKDAAAVMAVRGRVGVVRGNDYRGAKVLSALQPIPDSPWFMVAKVDAEEILAAWRSRSILILALTILLVLVAVAAAGLVWQRNDRAHCQSLVRAQAELRESEEKLSTTLNSIGDAVISTDVQGRVVGMNPVAEELTGWTLSEAIKRPICEVLKIVDALSGEPADLPVDEVLSTGEVRHLANHIALISCDGTQRQIADSAAPIRDDSGAITGAVLVFSDVTEQYRVREELRESEDKFRSLFESSSDAVMTLEPPSWAFASCNQATVEMFGAKDAEEFTSLGPWAVSPELQPDGQASGDKAKEMIETAMRDGSNFFEWTHMRIGGEEFPATVLLSRTEQGGKVFLQATVRDVSDKKRAEEAVKDTVRFQQVLMDAVPSPIFYKDSECVYIGGNKAFEQYLGLSPEQFIGKTVYDVSPVGLAEEYDKVDRALLNNPGVQTYEALVVHADGTPHNVVFNKATFTNPEGKVAGLIGVILDITESKQAEEALRESEDKYKVIYEGSFYGILVADSKTKQFIYANPAICRLLGYTEEELFQLSVTDIHPKDSLDHVMSEFEAQARGEKTLASELPCLRKDGTVFYADVTTALTILKGGRECITGFFADITERRELGQQLELVAAQIKGLMTQAVTGDSLAGRFTNPSLPRCWEEKKCTKTDCPAYGKTENLRCWEIAGTFCKGEVQGDFAKKYGDCSLCNLYQSARSNPLLELGEAFNAMSAILENRHAELSQAKADLQAANAQLEEALLVSKDHAAAVEIAKDQIEESVIELAHQATHDTLTRIPNRKYFEQHLSDLITGGAGRKSRSIAVLFLDLDKFKLINDTLGHKAGDSLLVEVAGRLQSCLRSADLLARMGGDEFTVILPRCNRRSIAEVVASRMIDSISRPFEIQGHKFVIGASIGLSSCPSDGTDAMSLLKHADAAMYKAKQAGRGTFRWFTGDVDVDNQQRADMEMDIRAALEKGQFNVYYQPIVSLEDGNILAAEALLRWEHPEKGMISPSLFIPIAEEIGMIGQIGDYVLRTACAQTMAWCEEGIHLSQIAVNVSTRQARDASWLDSISAALSDTGLDARCLSLELTETDFAADYESMRETLQEVERLGIGLAIDDFGIGQSSLSRLKDFPVIHLKIDGSFVRDIEHNKNDNALVRSIVEMAHGQCIKVTAEWVETESQMEILRSIGCDFAQGYFISPALPVEAFGDFFQEWTFAHREAAAA